MFATVRVTQLLDPPSAPRYDGWKVNERPPRIGDEGTLVDVFATPGHPASYVVESTRPDGSGITRWLAEFVAEELEEVVDPPG